MYQHISNTQFYFDIYKTYEKNSIIPVGKHFPGHGDTSKDSHLEMPICNLSFEELENIHIKPFKKAIVSNIPAIMVSHVCYKNFDEKYPASVSNKIINEYLRKVLNFKDVIISDDMKMGGISQYSEFEACKLGINAGINLFIYRNSENKIDLLKKLYEYALSNNEFKEKIEFSYSKIIELKNRFKIL